MIQCNKNMYLNYRIREGRGNINPFAKAVNKCVRGQGASNVIATTAIEAKRGKVRTKEGFVAETLKITHCQKIPTLKSIDS